MSRPIGSGRVFTPATIPTLQALYRQGHTYHAIAKSIGASYSTVYRACNGLGVYAGLGA